MTKQENYLTANDFEKIFRIIGKRLKTERERQNLSVLDLYDKSGVSGSYISNIENGKRKNASLFIYLKIAHSLNYDLEDLFKDLQNFPPYNH